MPKQWYFFFQGVDYEGNKTINIMFDPVGLQSLPAVSLFSSSELKKGDSSRAFGKETVLFLSGGPDYKFSCGIYDKIFVIQGLSYSADLIALLKNSFLGRYIS